MTSFPSASAAGHRAGPARRLLMRLGVLVPRFRRRSDMLLVLLDLACALGVCYLAFRLRFEGSLRESFPADLMRNYRILTVVTCVLWVLTGRISGLYRRSALRPGVSMLEPAFEASITVGVILLIVQTFLPHGGVSRAWIGLVILGLVLAGILSRGLLRRLRRAVAPLHIALERYAAVGDGPHARRLIADLTRAPGAPFELVGAIDGAMTPAQVAREARVLRLDGLVLPAEVDTDWAARLAAALSGTAIDVLLAPRPGELQLRVASIDTLQGVPLLRVAGLSPRRRAVRTRGVATRPLRRGVAILGTRGVPANYGGFETFAERLAMSLVAEEVPTTVYCRSAYASAPSPWNGIRLVSLPTIRSKHLDTPVHTFLSTLHLIFTRGPRDVVLCNAANAPVLLLLRLTGRRVVMNVDGLEWRRSKWGVAGRGWYRMGEWLSVRLASVLVTDAAEVQTYYRVRHDTDSIMVPYGADQLARGDPPEGFGVAADGFALYVSRWEQENNPLLVARAHARANLSLPLVMLGTATYDADLDKRVRAAAADNALLPGGVYGEPYRKLQASARCYIHATEVGGTHPALIEALGAGNLCLVLDTPENREVAEEVAWYFADEDDLARLLCRAAELSAEELSQVREQACRHVRDRYSWDAVCRTYLALLGGRA